MTFRLRPRHKGLLFSGGKGEHNVGHLIFRGTLRPMLVIDGRKLTTKKNKHQNQFESIKKDRQLTES